MPIPANADGEGRPIEFGFFLQQVPELALAHADIVSCLLDSQPTDQRDVCMLSSELLADDPPELRLDLGRQLAELGLEEGVLGGHVAPMRCRTPHNSARFADSL